MYIYLFMIIYLKRSLIEAYLSYNIVLASGVQYSDSIIRIYSDSFPL